VSPLEKAWAGPPEGRPARYEALIEQFWGRRFYLATVGEVSVGGPGAPIHVFADESCRKRLSEPEGFLLPVNQVARVLRRGALPDGRPSLLLLYLGYDGEEGRGTDRFLGWVPESSL
jgi:hypothetical protein